MNAQTTPHTDILVRGDSDVYVLVGYPVQQAKAPEAFEAVFRRYGIRAVLVPAAIAPARLEAFVAGVLGADNIRGLWATIPHKTRLMAMCQRCDHWGSIAGAVNAVRREADGSLTGALFDGQGFVAGLDFDGIAWTGRRTLLIGAGGAGAAIGASLACGERRVGQLALYDIDRSRAEALARRLQEHGATDVVVADSNDPAGYGLVVHASPLGMSPADPLPCEPARMDAGAALVDILMKNQPTPVVRAAWSRGLVAQPGFEMMIQQAPLYLDFFGFHAAAEAVRADSSFLRELVVPSAARSVRGTATA